MATKTPTPPANGKAVCRLTEILAELAAKVRVDRRGRREMEQSEFDAKVIPCMRYRDAEAAIAWLCDMLGFKRQLVVPGDAGTITHAQLVRGSGMVMLGSIQDDEYGASVTAASPNGRLTGSVYIVVADIEELYDRMRDAGANITMPLAGQHYGGSMFSVRDPEGQLWNIGSYDPWTPQA